MTTMFSNKAKKSIPKTLNDCYETDNLTSNLWVWCERLEKLGEILFWLIIIGGIILSIVSSISSQEVSHGTIYTYTTTETNFNFGLLITTLLQYALYAFVEYCTYHVIALLIGSLATITQHTKITADVALYKAAKSEPLDVAKDELLDVAKAEPTVMSEEGTIVNNSKEQINIKIAKCDMCEVECKKTYKVKIVDNFGTRHRNVCENCLKKYNCTLE